MSLQVGDLVSPRHEVIRSIDALPVNTAIQNRATGTVIHKSSSDLLHVTVKWHTGPNVVNDKMPVAHLELVKPSLRHAILVLYDELFTQ